jgi:hypothetical protein
MDNRNTTIDVGLKLFHTQTTAAIQSLFLQQRIALHTNTIFSAMERSALVASGTGP